MPIGAPADPVERFTGVTVLADWLATYAYWPPGGPVIVTVAFVLAVVAPLLLTVCPVKTWLVDVPAESVSVTVALYVPPNA